MRYFIALFVLGASLAACTTANDSEVEYVADGRAQSVEVAFIAPGGISFESDTTFVAGDSLYSRGDTTFVRNPPLPWKFIFDADDGQTLYLRVENLTGSGHVSSIILVDGDYRVSDGSAEPFGVAEVQDKL